MALQTSQLILEKGLKAGDPVSFFLSPDRRMMLVKDDLAEVRIDKLEPGYVSFDRPIVVKENVYVGTR